MAKTESSLKNMIITLLVITIVAGGSLGFVYQLTKGPIDLSKSNKQKMAISLVVPDFDNNPVEEVTELISKEETPVKVFTAKKDNTVVGYAIESISNKGFGGEVKIMTGYTPEGSIIGYEVLEHKETPGLGTKMDIWFKPSTSVKEETTETRQSFMQWFFGIKQTEKNSSIVTKNPKTNNLTVSKDNGEIDAITAATISSRAFLDAVNIGHQTFFTNNNNTSSTQPVQEGGAQ